MHLDPDQLRAAHADPDQPLVITAGAGSGKTRLLVERIALLLAYQRAGCLAPGHILALTFTRNAARELLERLHARLGEQSLDGLEVRTFHALGLALLRSGWAREYLGLERCRVATRSQVLQASADALAHAGLRVPPWAAPQVIGEAKIGRPSHVYEAARVHAARRAYDAWLRAQGLIDLHDMVVLPVEILRRHESARAVLQHRVAHVLGDEAQDWHAYQAALIAYAAGPAGHITVVGDHRQAIYTGSSPRYLLEFPLVFPHAQSFSLGTTYRLHGALLAVANAVAAHIAGATLPPAPHRPDGPLPTVHIARSAEAESAWIAREVQALVSSGALRGWHDAAVLTRTRKQRHRVAQALRAARVPCCIRAAPLTDRPSVGAVMAWLALLRDGTDSAALLRAIAAPPQGRQRAAPRSLRAALAATGPWTMERLSRECPPGLSDSQRRALAAFVRLYASLAQLVAGNEPTVAFDAVLERTGLQEWLTTADDGAVADLALMRDLVAQESDVGALQQMLSEEEADDRRDAVLVSTVHGFKGNEAEAVFVAGLDEGWFPHHVALAEGPEGLEEEVRAFYVALTRPRRLLYLSAACEPAGQQEGSPSRFLHLIPPKLLQSA